MKIKTVKELEQLYKNGILDEEDVIIFDKDRCELSTERDYSFDMNQGDIAWELLGYLGIFVSDS